MVKAPCMMPMKEMWKRGSYNYQGEKRRGRQERRLCWQEKGKQQRLLGRIFKEDKGAETGAKASQCQSQLYGHHGD